MKKKRILFLIHTLGGGGAEKVLINLVNNLDKNKYKITVMTVVDTGIYRSHLKPYINYKTIIKLPFKQNNNSGSLLSGSISKKKKFLIKLYTEFWKRAPLRLIYKKYIGNNYDIEVAFLEGICAKIIANSTNNKSKKYAWIHIDLLNQHKSENVFSNLDEEKEIYSRFDKIICVSNYVKEQFCKLFNWQNKSKVIVKHNVIDTNDILVKSKVPSPVERRKFTICSIGRLNKQKDYLRLAKCAYRLNKAGINFDVWIIGEGTQKEHIYKFIQEHDMHTYFKLLGFRSNPYSILKKADLFVCSSIAEGYSTSVVESLVLGIPVVTTDCAGMLEIFGGVDCGLITENDTNALYMGIEQVLKNKKLYMTLKKNAIKRGKDFVLKRSVSNITKLF